jgi:hypothetical protein
MGRRGRCERCRSCVVVHLSFVGEEEMEEEYGDQFNVSTAAQTHAARNIHRPRGARVIKPGS